MKTDFFAIRMLLRGILFLPSAALCVGDSHDESDCPLVIPEFDGTALLTREERIQVMDQALKDALNQVRDCRQTSGGMKKGDNNIPGSAAPDISGSDTGLNAAGAKGDAKAEQATMKDTGIRENNAENVQSARPNSELSGTENSGQRTGSMPDGKSPEDIPSADNDSIIARQIREAASSEPDPEKQVKLWNEYRRYKGLPEK